MLQKDYLLRQIERMGVILAGIRNMVVAGETVRARNDLEEVAGQLGVELDLLDALTPESLLEILGRTNLERLLPAAEVLLLKSEIEGAEGAEEGAALSREKAILMVDAISDQVGDGADPELRAQVESLRERVEA